MKKNISKVLSVALATAIAIGCMTGCANTKKEESSSTKVTSESTATSETVKVSEVATEEPVDYKDAEFRVTWWGGDNRHNSTIALIEEFEKNYQNLTIDVEYTAFGDYFTKLNTQATGDDLPDVIQMNTPQYTGLAESGILLPLDDYIASGAIDLSKVPDVAISVDKVNGVTYAVTTGTNIPLYIYNPALLEEAGVTISQAPTLEEFIEVAKKVYDKTGAVVAGVDFPDFCRMYGQSRYAADGKSVGFSPETLIAFWEMYADGVEYGWLPGSKNIEVVEDSVVSFAEKKIWAAREFSNNVEWTIDESGLDLELFAIPSVEGYASPTYMRATMQWSIAATSENPDLAAEFINSYINNPLTYDIVGMDRGVPINTEMREHATKSASEINKKVVGFMEYLDENGHFSASDRLDPANAAEASAVYPEYTEKVQYGMMARDEFAAAANEVVEKMNAILVAE